MSGPAKPSTVREPLRVALEALDALADAAERAGCAALFIEASAARGTLPEAAEFDGVNP